MSKKLIALIAGSIILSSCASQLHRGVVAMKIDDSNAHVGLNSDEVSIGDHVELYGNQCKKMSRVTDQTCTKVSKGHGVVTQILNDNYSSIKFDSGVAFQEGDFIEKHSH
ncbi:MAG: hypothetical protein B7Y39_04360 [Bdellovibrio sp. 28-41-41]|nr:MAG: hypothetical protein B7Y39_04360 [Bdellovibrio sp. 28-41-41]